MTRVDWSGRTGFGGMSGSVGITTVADPVTAKVPRPLVEVTKLLIGILMVLITRLRPGHHLVRPFWGVGVLGGYTTFSTASVDVLRASPGTALVYLGATLIGALLAVWAGTAATEAMLRR